MSLRQELRRFIYRMFPDNPELLFGPVRDKWTVQVWFNGNAVRPREFHYTDFAFEFLWFYIRIGRL